MKIKPSEPRRNPSKAPTGIVGFDEITQGGLSRGRTTLLEGGAGSGKSIMALQSLVNAAQKSNEPGIFVAFEESPERIKENVAKFGWDLDALARKKLFFLDAQPNPELVSSGSFDLDGMLAALGAKVREMGAKRIVFDALDVVLSLMNDPVAERRELYKLHEWLLASGLTAIITAKADSRGENEARLGFMQFMVDCAVRLRHSEEEGKSQRSLRVLKYRGSAFEEDASPFVIGDSGLEVAGSRDLGRREIEVSDERISSGVARLDTMLGGGYYRGSSVLITGFPGTAKSTLAGAFAEASCERGESTLFVTFDSDAVEIIRNLRSVNIRLERFVKNGLLHTKSTRGIMGSAEIHLMRIKRVAREHKVRILIIDPVSALSKGGSEGLVHSVAERLIDWAKFEGITLLCSSLLEGTAPGQMEGTPVQISTIADTWIHLNYIMHAGERNRGISIVKSRGTSHSNQVRELILSDKGITLADAYTGGGEVLMGTLRWEKEQAERNAHSEAEISVRRQRNKIENDAAELQARIKSLQYELELKNSEKDILMRTAATGAEELSERQNQIRGLRQADEAIPVPA
jgi:circadian clock protein KaiC